jgi:putative addiction module component (TIGR02574 family)
MHGTREIILEATALPVEERVIIVDSLLRSLNMPDRGVEKEWIAVAHRRLEELHSGRVRAIPGDEVFANIRKRFAQ